MRASSSWVRVSVSGGRWLCQQQAILFAYLHLAPAGPLEIEPSPFVPLKRSAWAASVIYDALLRAALERPLAAIF